MPRDASTGLWQASQSQLTSTSLLDRAKANDPVAWQRVVDLYGPFVYGWCRRWGIEPSAASDIVQEVFRRTAAGIGRFQSDRPGSTFRGWLWTITRNQARDHCAAQDKRPKAVGGTDMQIRMAQVPAPLEDTGCDATPPADEEAACMRRALELIRGDFQPQTWVAFWRTAIDGQTTDEVAAELGMNKGAVRQAKHRVMERLHEEFDQLLG